MKSFSAMLYVEAAVRSIAHPCTSRRRLAHRARHAAAGRLLDVIQVKQRPDACGNRPLAPGIGDTPFSSIVFSSAPFSEA